ncbi:MAG: ABC transporter ATP-binding protein [Clostridiales Family XIII bacterium]|jgi:teichoic acid transport system ATP-binding protein|nr:ABC transporter ATP-binding protein [Clostridiales Family XIII bacterium]
MGGCRRDRQGETAEPDRERKDAVGRNMESTDRKTAIEFRNVTKTYKLYRSDKLRLLSVFWKGVKHTEKRAVDNVSFSVRQGESLAFIGRNGAGKSTILKMITGVAFPTEGDIVVEGRVSALLELTAGFDEEMSGRDNIYLKGQLMGLKDKEIERREEEIVAFAELGEYIDQPVRTYSSGMRAKLGFAVNVCIEPEVFIVDEALSVGDKVFQAKCLEKVNALIEKDNVTLIFVTHSIDVAKKFCKRGIVLKEGRMVCDTDIEQAAAYYEQHMADN